MITGVARVGWQSLIAHPLRAALTMLGVVIGVAAVIAMVAIGNGARERIDAQIRSLGANLIGISQGSVTTGAVRLGAGSALRLNEDDARAIRAEVPGMIAVAPILYSRPQLTAAAMNWTGKVYGVTPDFFIAREWRLAEGREMIPEDHSRGSAVVLLGKTMREKLVGNQDPVGMTIRIRGVPFTVIGILERKGQNVWGDDDDDIALVPLSTARRRLVGVNVASPRAVHGITVKFASSVSASETMTAVGSLLRERHRIPPGQDETFVLRNLAEVARVQHAATGVMSAFLAAVASVSLVVGGIGIMNIMMVSVTERTREIGLRLAVGARRHDILVQFLVEAVTLALLGGTIGVFVGIGAAVALAHIGGWPVLIDLASVLLAVGFAGLVGVFFGLYPARHAARLDPIVALRYE
ncbi:MAG TPA: ABC transporter permease [Methylomirabilota bacterium]|nr:ABC transporter permease [Methylomirabilota bacterium]